MKTESLYVHIPFCDNICTYCDFAKVYYDDDLANRYLDALAMELQQRANNKFVTVYIGGGTPSALNEGQLEKLLGSLQEYLQDDTEFTIEANPESLSPAKIKLLQKYRVNRVSLGVQTFNEQLLSTLNRKHNNAMVEAAVAGLKQAGITNINIDLMYGLQGQSLADIKNDLDHFNSLDVPHISYYSLILEEHTILAGSSFQEQDDDALDQIGNYINDYLAGCGYEHYEISNYAKENRQSRHNLAYWHYLNYLGIGVGAASKIDNQIISNNRNLYKYLNRKNIQEATVLTKEESMFNHVMMNLRLKAGLDINEFNHTHQIDFVEHYHQVLEKHLGQTMVVKAGFLVLSEAAYNNLNSILVDFL